MFTKQNARIALLTLLWRFVQMAVTACTAFILNASQRLLWTSMSTSYGYHRHSVNEVGSWCRMPNDVVMYRTSICLRQRRQLGTARTRAGVGGASTDCTSLHRLSAIVSQTSWRSVVIWQRHQGQFRHTAVGQRLVATVWSWMSWSFGSQRKTAFLQLQHIDTARSHQLSAHSLLPNQRDPSFTCRLKTANKFPRLPNRSKNVSPSYHMHCETISRRENSTPYLKKLCKIVVSELRQISTNFDNCCRRMAKRLKLWEVHSFSTSPNLHHHTTMLNAAVPNSYTTLWLLVLDCTVHTVHHQFNTRHHVIW